jgi:choline-glycine betaine transporter
MARCLLHSDSCHFELYLPRPVMTALAITALQRAVLILAVPYISTNLVKCLSFLFGPRQQRGTLQRPSTAARRRLMSM